MELTINKRKGSQDSIPTKYMITIDSLFGKKISPPSDEAARMLSMFL